MIVGALLERIQSEKKLELAPHCLLILCLLPPAWGRDSAARTAA